MRAPRVAAAAVVLATVVATWCLSGVTLGEAGRFAGYELGYTLLPGCMLYLALSPRPGRLLWVVAIGWPCGYALEVGWFALTAAIHWRAGFALLPAIALVTIGLPLLARHRGTVAAAWRRLVDRGRSSQREGGGPALAVAGAISGALVVLALTFYAAAPLPAHAHSVVYGADSVFDISLAAEARHHWPITEPWVAGQPMHYYLGAFIHIAAVNQVSGVPLATVVLRLFPSVMLLLVALQIWALGDLVGRSRWAGAAAAVLLLVAEDVNLAPTHSAVFAVNPFTQFSLSPSFAFGAPMFLGLITLIQSRIAGEGAGDDGGRRTGPADASPGAVRALVLVAVLALGCASAKTFAIADLVGGLGIFWLWYVARSRMGRFLGACLVVTAVCTGVVYFAMLSGGMSSTLHVRPFDFATAGDTLARGRVAVQSLLGHSFIWILALGVGALAVAVCVFAPLLAAAWLMRSRRTISPGVGLLLAMFTAGAIGYVTFGAPGGVEGVFIVYGYLALAPVAGAGLVRLWGEIPAQARRELVRAGALVFALGLSGAIAIQVVLPVGRARDAAYALAYGALAGWVAIVALRQSRPPVPGISSRAGRLAACCLPLIAVSAFVKPTTLTAVGLWKAALGQPAATVDSSADYGMTAAMYDGLLWARRHTTDCDVLAVNNHFGGPQPIPASSVYFYYSAFTERRVYLESWFYTPDGTLTAQPFPARLKLNTEAVSLGRASALRRLREQGVSYILVDKLHGGALSEPASVSRLVFSNSALDIYRLSGADTRSSCGAVT